MTLRGRRVIVTGAANGIGRATARRLLEGRATVALFDRAEPPSPLEPKRAEQEARVRWFRVDVSDETEAKKAVEDALLWMGGIDVLVHAAGIMKGQGVPITELDPQVWDEVIRVNLYGTYTMTRLVCAHMIEQGSGAIVLTSSGAGVTGPSGSLAYAASKGGMHGFALTLEAGLRPHGIRVNELCPGLVDTPLLRESIKEGIASGSDRAAYDAVTSSMITPEAVADIAAFLASSDADQVRGAVFTY